MLFFITRGVPFINIQTVDICLFQSTCFKVYILGSFVNAYFLMLDNSLLYYSLFAVFRTHRIYPNWNLSSNYFRNSTNLIWFHSIFFMVDLYNCSRLCWLKATFKSIDFFLDIFKALYFKILLDPSIFAWD